MRWISVLFGLVFAVGLGACSPGTIDPIQGCEASDRMTPICAFQSPEDIEVLPGETALLVGEYGGLGGTVRGTLKVLHLADHRVEVLYPKPGAAAAGVAGQIWGDPACPGPPGEDFAAHGIHLATRADGARQVLVVNHVKREAIEFFELRGEADAFELVWRGCAVAPDELWLNDVVALPEGGFVATHMLPRGSGIWTIRFNEWTGRDTGYAVEWQPETGWNEIPGSAGNLTNGIEISEDGKTLFINYYLGNRVVALDRAGGTRLWEISVSKPDNSSWSADGRLLVAGHSSSIGETLLYSEMPGAGCPLPFTIVAVDPADGSSEVMYAAEGPPMGGVTTAVQVGDALYFGSFTGDRMARLALPE